MRHSLVKILAGSTLALALLAAGAAASQPIKLKLAFYTSDQANVYEVAVKPFVDAVNAEGTGILAIEVYFSGALGKSQSLQPQLVADGGVADIAFVIPGITPDRFQDNAVIEMPGLFRDMREATLTYTRLIAANALKGYEDFYVIGAFASDLESIHTRPAVSSLDDLKGKKIRANNMTEATALQKLGMVPVVMPINTISESISRGDLDGAAVPPSMLFEFGIARVATYHYFLRISPAPFAVLMNRKTFDGLPAPAQDIIRKYSGEWAAARYIEGRDVLEGQVMAQLKADSRRKVIFPSQSEIDVAEEAFKVVRAEWADTSPHYRQLLNAVEAEILKYRSER